MCLLEREAMFFWKASQKVRAMKVAGLPVAEDDIDDLDVLALNTASPILRAQARATISAVDTAGAVAL